VSSDETGADPRPASSDLDRRALLRHELRTPLNQILGYSELLEEEAQSEGAAERMVPDLHKIQNAARRMLLLIDALFVPSSGPGAQSVAPEPFDGDDTGVTWKSSDRDDGAAPSVHGPESKSRLLVVDDSAANLDMLTRRLRGRGYEVTGASDGPGALRAIEKEPFDAVLLDVVMPGMSGLEVLETIRLTHSVADLPVIMATSRDGSGHIVEALRLGANDYVTKPLDFPVVRARLKTQLLLKQARDRLQRVTDELALRNRFITKTFGRYLSDEVVARLLEAPGGLLLGGERRTVTMLMSDLRGFTSISEELSPEQVVRLLNNYLGEMADLVAEYRGLVDEFVGDAILAIFGAPLPAEGDAERAVACAVAMQRAMDGINARNEAQGLPRIEMGIAVHTGEVVVGNIGSEQRTKYGIVGSQVNLTARIESHTVGGQVLISRPCLEAAGEICDVGGRFDVRAKGFSEPLTAFEVRGIRGSYNLEVPRTDTTLSPAATPVPIRFWILSDKQVGESSFPGSLVALSPAGGLVRTERRVRALSNVMIQLGNGGSDAPGAELYAKVVGSSPDGTGFEIRFTSVPLSTRRRLDEWGTGGT
jgi:adenylate cyclase